MMTDSNDQFMFALRRDPDPEFAHALHARLKAPPPKPSLARRALKWAAAASVIFAALLIASPEARAQIAHNIERLFYGDVELRVVSTDRLGGSITQMPVEKLTPAEAQAVFAHKTPAWVPNGYTQEATVSFIQYSDADWTLGYRWLWDSEAQKIILSVLNRASPQLVIGQGANSHEIVINGVTGAVFSGAWDNQIWNPTGYRTLAWVEDGVTYYLGSEAVPESDLLRMAESMR